jgi:hypothetical protein
MTFTTDALITTLRQAHPTSHVRVLPEPAMFLRSSTGRTYTAEGMQITSTQGALDYAQAYMNGLTERAKATEGFELNSQHPWIIGVFPGSQTSAPLIFIFGNIIRYGTETWVEVGFPTYEQLRF